jgi:hypothetical protein
MLLYSVPHQSRNLSVSVSKPFTQNNAAYHLMVIKDAHLSLSLNQSAFKHLYNSQNKQLLFPYAALTDSAL